MAEELLTNHAFISTDEKLIQPSPSKSERVGKFFETLKLCKPAQDFTEAFYQLVNSLNEVENWAKKFSNPNELFYPMMVPNLINWEKHSSCNWINLTTSVRHIIFINEKGAVSIYGLESKNGFNIKVPLFYKLKPSTLMFEKPGFNGATLWRK